MTQAAPDRARLSVLAIPNELETKRIFNLVRTAKLALPIVGRAEDDDELEHFRTNGAALARLAENELGHSMSRYVLDQCAQQPSLWR